MLSEEDTTWISSLTVAKLKDELKRRSLPVSGLKAELAARLTEAIESEKKEQKPDDDDLKEPSADQKPAAAGTSEHAEIEPEKDVEEADESKKQIQAKPADDDQKVTGEAEHGNDHQPMQEAHKKQAATVKSKTVKQADNRATETAAEAAASEEVDFGSEDEHHVDGADQTPGSGKQQAQEPTSAQKDDSAGTKESEEKVKEKQEQKPVEPARDEQATTSNQKSSNDKPREEPTSGKRRREPIQFQPKAKTAAVKPIDTPESSAKPAAQPINDQSPKATPSAETGDQATDTKAVSPQQPETDAQQLDTSTEPGSRGIRIDNLVRPFTENSLRTLISQTGSITDLWMPSIKTHAFVILESDEQGAATKRALDGIQWPEASHKRLAVTLLSVDEAEHGIAVGRDPSKARAGSGRVSGSGLRTAQSIDANKGSQPRVSGAAARAAVAAAVAGAGDERGTLKRGRPDDQEVQATEADEDVERAAKRSKPTADESVVSADAAPANDVDMAGQQQAEEKEEAVLSLDQLFRKTETKPHLYWLPLTEEQIKEKKERLVKEEELRAKGIHPADPTSPSHHHPEHHNGMHPEPYHRPPFAGRQGAGPMERGYPPFRDQHGPSRYGNVGGGGGGGYQGRGYGGPPRFRR